MSTVQASENELNTSGMTSRLYVDALWQDTLKHQMLMRLLTKFELGLTRQPIDLEYFEFICRNEVYLWNALSRHIDMPAGLLEALESFFYSSEDTPGFGAE